MSIGKQSLAGLLALALTSGLAASAFAANWQESVNGDLSSNNNSPTPFALELGPNLVAGTNTSTDRDYLRADVPAGHLLTQVILNVYSGNDLSFSAMQIGNSMVAPSTVTAAGLTGWTHYGNGGGAEPIASGVKTCSR